MKNKFLLLMCVVVFMAQNTTKATEPALKITFEKFAYKYPKTATLIGIGVAGGIAASGAAALKYAQLVHGTGENSKNKWVNRQIANEAITRARGTENLIDGAFDLIENTARKNPTFSIEPGSQAHGAVEYIWEGAKKLVKDIPQKTINGVLNLTKWNSYSRQYDDEILYPAMKQAAQRWFLPGCILGLALHY